MKMIDKNGRLTESVERRISNYLGFDLSLLLKGTDAIVFGGAVRDSIISSSINDIDIAAMPQSKNIICNRLIDYGYQHFTIDSGVDWVDEEYLEVGFLFSPINFKKDNKHIQIICPRWDDKDFKPTPKNLYKFVSNVDFSNCGMVYAYDKVGETIEGSFSDIMNKQFRAYKENFMYVEKNAEKRIQKFINRGWKYIQDKKENDKFKMSNIKDFWGE